jgi:hypothetical protein
MKLSEIYEEMFIKDAWDKLEEALNETVLLEEGNTKLDALIQEAEKVVFSNFGIDSSEKKYFIAGSARLYLYPGLIDFINELTEKMGKEYGPQPPKTPSEPGDLDIVIPSKEDWIKLKNNVSGKVDTDVFESNFNKKIFRPNELGLTNMDIEAFDEWAPQRAGGEYSNTKVDDTRNILNRATKFNDHYFMNMYDVINYKFQMGRTKDLKIAQLINSYITRREKRSKGDLFKILSRIIRMRYNPTTDKN